VLLRRHRKAPIGNTDQHGRVEEHKWDILQRQKTVLDEKISLNVSRRAAIPACMAGVRTSRPNFSAL
jgi:hypothetical protein